MFFIILDVSTCTIKGNPLMINIYGVHNSGSLFLKVENEDIFLSPSSKLEFIEDEKKFI